MSEPWAERTPAPAAALLVPRARTGVRLEFLPLALLVAAVYAGIAAWAPLTSQSAVAVVLLTAIVGLTTSIVLCSPNRDRLDLFRAASLFFVGAYGIGALFEPGLMVWYLEQPYPVLLQRTAALALVAYLAMAAGYYLPVFQSIPRQIPARHERVDARLVAPLALGLWITGFLFFWIFFVSAGGAGVILRGEGGVGRHEFGSGIGIFWWPLLWMTPGGALYFAARASLRKSRKWLAAWPLVLEFALLLLLQGRHRAIGPLIMGMVISHYMIRPVRLGRLAIYLVAGAFLSILVAEFRSPSMRAMFFANPGALLQTVLEHQGDAITGLVVADIDRVATTMIVIDKVPEVRPYAWGNTLLLPLNPIFRLVGLPHLQAPVIGAIGYELARPELQVIVSTGFLPSIVGEMRWNFPWYLCVLFYGLYGAGLRALYQGMIVKRGDFAAVAIYAIAGLYAVEMIIGTFAQNLFELADVVVPAVLIRMIALRRRATVATAEGLALPSAGATRS